MLHCSCRTGLLSLRWLPVYHWARQCGYQQELLPLPPLPFPSKGHEGAVCSDLLFFVGTFTWTYLSKMVARIYNMFPTNSDIADILASLHLPLVTVLQLLPCSSQGSQLTFSRGAASALPTQEFSDPSLVFRTLPLWIQGSDTSPGPLAAMSAANWCQKESILSLWFAATPPIFIVSKSVSLQALWRFHFWSQDHVQDVLTPFRNIGTHHRQR